MIVVVVVVVVVVVISYTILTIRPVRSDGNFCFVDTKMDKLLLVVVVS